MLHKVMMTSLIWADAHTASGFTNRAYKSLSRKQFTVLICQLLFMSKTVFICRDWLTFSQPEVVQWLALLNTTRRFL